MTRHGRRAHLLAYGLALLAGFVDALGFLKLGGMFVSFMSGNSTRMAVGLFRATGGATMAGMLIGCFVAGVIVGSLIVAVAPDRQRKAAVLAAVALALLAAAMLGRSIGGNVVLAMALAMGCANTVFQRDGEVSIGVTYMTGTLVKLGQRISNALLGGDRAGWIPYLLLWLALIVGATAGSASYARSGLDSLWFAAAWAAALSGVAWLVDLRGGVQALPRRNGRPAR